MKTSQLKRVSLLAGLVLSGALLFAQNSFEIRGKVVKSDRPEGNHATVTLVESNSMEIVAEETCNDNGEFLIENLAKGNYILLVQKPGYSKPERRFISISDKGNVVQTADLGSNNQESVSKKIM